MTSPRSTLPKYIVSILMISTFFAFLLPALIVRFRAVNSVRPRIHIIQNMDNQARFKAQQANPLFADGRGMRPPVPGTVARERPILDDHHALGFVDGAWATTFPPGLVVNRSFLERGQDRFGIYCALCHGQAGYGDGIIHARANELVLNPLIGNGTTWVQPGNMHAELVREKPVGEIYHIITNGSKTMSGYRAQVPLDDRWAIAAYVKALQESQSAAREDLADTDYQVLPLVDLAPESDESVAPVAEDEEAGEQDASEEALP